MRTYKVLSYPCNECDKTFSTKENFNNHIKNHKRSKNYDYKYCNKTLWLVTS